MFMWAGATATSGVSIQFDGGVTNSDASILANAPGDSVTLMPSYADQIYYIKAAVVQ